MKRKIGIIGGMGAQATVDLFQKIIDLTPAQCDQDHIPLLIDNQTQIPDRMSYILDNNQPNPSTELINSAQCLQKMGAEALIMPCNTAHFFANKIKNKVTIPLIHIVDTTISALNQLKSHDKSLAILATVGTRRSLIYDQPLANNGYKIESLSNSQQMILHDIIYKGAKAGRIGEYAEPFNHLITEIKSQTIILACTELPLFLPYLKPIKRYIDPTAILAQAAINYSLGKSN